MWSLCFLPAKKERKAGQGLGEEVLVGLLHQPCKLIGFSQLTPRRVLMEGTVTVKGPIAGPEWQSVCRTCCGCFQNRLECYVWNRDLVSFSLVELNPELSLKNIDPVSDLPTSLLLRIEVYRELFVVNEKERERREKPAVHRLPKKVQHLTASHPSRLIFQNCLLVFISGWIVLMSLMVLHNHHALSRGHL